MSDPLMHEPAVPRRSFWLPNPDAALSQAEVMLLLGGTEGGAMAQMMAHHSAAFLVLDLGCAGMCLAFLVLLFRRLIRAARGRE